MAQVLIIAHAPLASALHSVARHVLPHLADHIRTLDVAADDRLEDVEQRARALLLDAAGAPREALVLTDIEGATPGNVAWRLADGERVRVLAGVNPTMLIRAITYHHVPLEQQAMLAHEGGLGGINFLASKRQQQQQNKPTHDQEPGHHQQ